MLNAQSSDETLDRTTLFLNTYGRINENVLSRLFEKYGPKKIYCATPPKNYAFIAFNNEGDAQKAMLDLGNQPPFNLNIAFARKSPHNKKIQNSVTKSGMHFRKSGAMSEVTESKYGVNKTKSEGHLSNHSSSPCGSSASSVREKFTNPVKGSSIKNNAVMKSNNKKQTPNVVNILVDKTLDLIKNEQNLIESVKVNEWFGRALKDFINLYMDNVKNPSENIQSIHKEFQALTEEDFAKCDESDKEEVTIPRASVAEGLGVGENMKLSITSAERTNEALVCVTVSGNVQEQYESLYEEFSRFCEKQNPTAAGKASRGGLMAVKLSTDGKWYRAVMQDQGWAFLDDGHVVSSDDVQCPMPCPQPYSDIPFFCCLLTHDVKILNESIPFTVKVLSKDNESRIMEVTLSNDEYGLHFKGKLKPWIPSIISISAECGKLLPQKRVQSKSKQNNQGKTVQAVPKTVRAPSHTVPIIPKVRKFVAEVCNEGEELSLSVISAEGKGLLCLTLRDSFSGQYESLVVEFASVCEKQKPAGNGSGEKLMAVRLASDNMWYRAVPHDKSWALVDDGCIVTYGEVQRTVLCPQPYADIPFFCCLLMHDIKMIDYSVPYTVKIIRKDEATRSLNVKIWNSDIGASFDGRLQPWPFTAEEQFQRTTNGFCNGIRESSPEQKILPAVFPKFIKFAAENCKEGEELNISVLSTEGKGLLCLTLSNSTAGQYESLCAEFASVCEKQKPASNWKENKGVLMAVKLASDCSWYRAILLDQGWVLPDDGRTVSLGEVQSTVLCPQPYANIPFFCCLLLHSEKNIDIEIPYSVKVVRKDEAARSLHVKVYNKDSGVSFDGTLHSWLSSTAEKSLPPTTTCLSTVCTSEKPKLSNTASPVVSYKTPEKKNPTKSENFKSMKSGGVIYKDMSFPEKELNKSTTENTVTEIRKCMAETCSVGEEMNLSLMSTDEKGTGQICLTVCERTRQDYESLCEKFAQICGKEPMPAGNDRGGLMAVRLYSDCMWYRAVTNDRGWALLDDGRTVTSEEVMRVLPCPRPYADIPFFCCLLEQDTEDVEKLLQEGLCYTFKVLSKDETNRTMSIILSNAKKNISTYGTLRPWITCTTTTCKTTARTSGRLSSVNLAPSEPIRVSNVPIMSNEIPKLAIRSGSLVTLVKFVHFDKVFLRLADDESNTKYLLHLDSLAVYGFKAPPLDRTPLPGEVVLCKHNDDQYYRATVMKCDTTKQTCDVEFLDLCLTWTVAIKGLRPCPSWVGQVPPPLNVSLAQLKSCRYNNASLAYIKELKQKKAVLKCKEYSESGVHLIVQQNMHDVNETLLELSTPMWKKLQKQGKSVLSLPIVLESNIKYQPMIKGHPVRITDTGMIIIGAVSCVPHSDKLNNQLADLTEQINEYCNCTPDPYLPRQGEVCLHKHEDGNWRRAYVVDVNKDLVDVRSLDHGKIIYNLHFSLIRKMICEFVEPLPALALLCTFDDFPKEPSKKLVVRSQKILEANPIVIPTILAKDAPGVYKIIIPALTNLLKKEGLL